MANMSQSWGHPWPCASGAHQWRTTPLLLIAPDKASCLSSKPLGLTLTLKPVCHPGLMHPHIYRSRRGISLVRSQSYPAGKSGVCLLDMNPFIAQPTCHPQNRLSLFFLFLLPDALFLSSLVTGESKHPGVIQWAFLACGLGSPYKPNSEITLDCVYQLYVM